MSILSSTSSILGALQAAHITHKGMVSCQTAMQQPAQLLPDLPRLYKAPRLYLSPDSRWCAVSFESGGTCIAGENHGLCLYDTHAGRLVHVLHGGVVGGYIIK